MKKTVHLYILLYYRPLLACCVSLMSSSPNMMKQLCVNYSRI